MARKGYSHGGGLIDGRGRTGHAKALRRPMEYAKENPDILDKVPQDLTREHVLSALAVKRELVRRNARMSLLAFSREILGYKDVDPAVHGELCRHLEDAYWARGDWKNDETAIRRYLFLLPRGSFKSTICTISYPLWVFIQNDPQVGEGQELGWTPPRSFNGKKGCNQRILIGSNVESNAIRFLSNIKDHCESGERLRELFGSLAPEKRVAGLWVADKANVTWRTDFRDKEANLSITSGDGSPVSGHYDMAIMDDMVDDKRVTNDEQIQQMLDWYRRLIPIMQPGPTLMIFVGTRWHDKDLYGYFIDEESSKWTVYRESAERSDEEMSLGKSRYFFPAKMGAKELADYKSSMRPYIYSCQFLNEPLSSSEAIFKKEYFEGRYYELPTGNNLNEFLKDKTIITTIDPAITSDKRGCHAVVITMAWDHMGNGYILDLFRRQAVHPSDLLDVIFEHNKLWKPMLVGIEEDGFQRMYRFEADQRSMTSGVWPPWIGLKPNRRSKELRISGLEPLFRARRVWLRNDAVQSHTAIEEEALRFPRGRWRDALDALAYQIDIAFHGSEPATPAPEPETQAFNAAFSEEVHRHRLERLGIVEPESSLDDWMTA